jgi:hypothetical protein
MVALRILVACGLVAAGISGVRAETLPYAGMQNRSLKALSEQQIEICVPGAVWAWQWRRS